MFVQKDDIFPEVIHFLGKIEKTVYSLFRQNKTEILMHNSEKNQKTKECLDILDKKSEKRARIDSTSPETVIFVPTAFEMIFRITESGGRKPQGITKRRN